MAQQQKADLTIDELARETGMTVRNIRAHQSRGLLQPPSIRARTGYYGDEHITRLRLIKDMQSEGFNLRAIQRLLERADGDGDQVLDFGRVALGAFPEEEPEFATQAELEQRFGGPFEPKTARKAERLGLVRTVGNGRFEILSPTLVGAGEELVALGIPLSHALAVVEKLQRHSRATAREFVRLFMEDVVGERRGPRGPEDWERLRQALERLTPLSTDALRATFQQTMSRAVEQTVEQLLNS